MSEAFVKTLKLDFDLALLDGANGFRINGEAAEDESSGSVASGGRYQW